MSGPTGRIFTSAAVLLLVVAVGCNRDPPKVDHTDAASPNTADADNTADAGGQPRDASSGQDTAAGEDDADVVMTDARVTDAGADAGAEDATNEFDGGIVDAAGASDGGPSADCSRTFADVTKPLCDGTYAQDIGPGTFPRGSEIRALTPGLVRFSGEADLGSHLTFRGIVFENQSQKALGDSNLFEDCSFVGGPACGNTVNADVGANTTIRRSAFYGPGGRYLLLAYRVQGVVLEDIILRRDGGWGERGPSCTEYEPTAGLNFYDSPGATGARVVAFDAVNEADSSAEDLGEIVVNCHDTCSGNALRDSLVRDALSGAFRYEGNGEVADAQLINSVAWGGSYGLTRNVAGTTIATRVTLEGTEGACACWRGTVELVDSQLDGTNQCSGNGGGAGAELTLSAEFLNRARWRKELCTDQGVTRGWCATSSPLSAYLSR